ncbi:dimethylargininase [Glaciihabitans tibetensis]|uniref:Dimethylargininase n=1 Tax=Glaciihabitans tibetensis TaxID=1266600 RepID=A0A2T0VBU5_9MICO|nr:dimethylargininase [Glaciihabitans tibetensis]PRY67632.1 dimethylargininase [Glaciihabitans tibetensis]
MTSRAPLLPRLTAAMVSALAVAAITQVATTLFFHATNGAVSAQLESISSFFAISSLLLFVLVAIAAMLGLYRRWFITLPVALVISVIASLAGTVITFISSGNALTAEVWPSVFDTLRSNNLFFVVFAVIAIVTAGAAVWRAVLARSAASRAGMRTLALVRLPSSNLAEGELTHLERTPIDAELADTQWEKYVAALEAEGFTTVEVPAADGFADSVFVEDAVVILDNTAVLTSPGAESRRGEIEGVAAAIPGLDLGMDVETIELPGTLDGGDVLKVGRTVYVGRGGRTNAEGIRQFRAIAIARGFEVVAVPVSRVLHLKSAVTALPDGTVIGYAPLVERPELFTRFLAVPEETGAAVVVLSPDTVLMAASAPLSAALIEDLGYRVVTVDISEFEKLEGCVTCLSVRIR